jgi:hypothetical protein
MHAKHRTPGGSLVHEYDPEAPAYVGSTTVGEGWRTALGRHLDLLLGPCDSFPDEGEGNPSVSVLAFAPNTKREYMTLVTDGASSRAMAAPAYETDRRHQELVLYVAPVDGQPPPWALTLLRRLGRFAHEQRTFLGPGHTVAFENPPRPLADDTLLAAVLLTPPIFEEPAFDRLSIDGDEVRFLNVVPITSAELDVKLERGLDALYDVLANGDLHQIVDLGRACLVTGETPATTSAGKRGRWRRRDP